MMLELTEAVCGNKGEIGAGVRARVRFFSGVALSLDCEASALIVFETANELLQARCAQILFPDRHIYNLDSTHVESDFLFGRVKLVTFLIQNLYIDVRLALDHIAEVFSVINER
jgi:hypothetical protein